MIPPHLDSILLHKSRATGCGHQGTELAVTPNEILKRIITAMAQLFIFLRPILVNTFMNCEVTIKPCASAV